MANYLFWQDSTSKLGVTSGGCFFSLSLSLPPVDLELQDDADTEIYGEEFYSVSLTRCSVGIIFFLT